MTIPSIAFNIPYLVPTGSADVNHFHAAGGMGFLTRELLDAGLLHGDIATVGGVVANECDHLFVAHLRAERLRGVAGRAVNHQHLVAVFQR